MAKQSPCCGIFISPWFPFYLILKSQNIYWKTKKLKKPCLAIVLLPLPAPGLAIRSVWVLALPFFPLWIFHYAPFPSWPNSSEATLSPKPSLGWHNPAAFLPTALLFFSSVGLPSLFTLQMSLSPRASSSILCPSLFIFLLGMPDSPSWPHPWLIWAPDCGVQLSNRHCLSDVFTLKISNTEPFPREQPLSLRSALHIWSPGSYLNLIPHLLCNSPL